MSVAGSSATRITTKRNRTTTIGPRERHVASTDATHVPDLKERRRKVAEPPQEQGILVPSKDVKLGTDSYTPSSAACSTTPRPKPGRSSSMLLKASSSTVHKRRNLSSQRSSVACTDASVQRSAQETNNPQSEDLRSRIDGEDAGETPTSTLLETTNVPQSKKRKRKVPESVVQDTIVLAPTTDSKSSTDSFDARSILPKVKPAKSLSRLLEASSSSASNDAGSSHRNSVEHIADYNNTQQEQSGSQERVEELPTKRSHTPELKKNRKRVPGSGNQPKPPKAAREESAGCMMDGAVAEGRATCTQLEATTEPAQLKPITTKTRRDNESTIEHQFPSTDLKSGTELFDARSILPTEKPAKSVSSLLEATSAVKQRDASSHQISFQCIDGFTRAYDKETLLLQTEDPEHHQQPSTVGETMRECASPMLSETSPERPQFKAFGIEAFPTKAKYNDICYDFVSTLRWCPNGYSCPRIHPLNKRLFLPGVIQECVRARRMREEAVQNHDADALAGPLPSTEHNAPDPIPASQAAHKLDSAPVPPTSSTTPTPSLSPIRVNLPATASSFNPSVKLPTARTELPPRHRVTHRVAQNSSMDYVQNWDAVYGLSRWDKTRSERSHSSSDSDNERVAICRKIASPDPFPLENWDPRVDESAWSDSNVTDDSPSNRVSVGRETSVPSAPLGSSSGTNPTASAYTLKKSPATMEKVLTCEPQVARRPRPRTNERCKDWLRNQCNRGYTCAFVHGDLDYLDDTVAPRVAVVSGVNAPLKGAIAAHLTSQPERTFVRRPPETFGRVLHHHIHLKFGAGFQVTELDTGFESPWIFVRGFPDQLTDYKIETLLRQFGDVTEIRRPLQPVSPLSVKVHFSKASEAFKAFTALNGAVEFGRKLDTRMAVENKRSGTLFQSTTLRIDWDAPARNVYMGYADLERAERAVQQAKRLPYGEYQPTAALHYALPAVGKVTVKFTGVPPDVTEKGMEIYGEHQGMVTERPNYAGKVDETIVGVRKLLTNFRSKIVDFEVKSAPYREGKMRAWAVFASPKDAEAAAQDLHNRKPASTGHTRVTARHIKSISFSLSVHKACKVAAQIKAFSENIWRQGGGYSLSIQDKGVFVSLRLCGEDLKVLGRLKAELERMLNGEAVMEDGKMVWDDYFGRQHGFEFLVELEKRFPGVVVERMLLRRSIRLFGVAEKRAEVRKKIIEKVAERRQRNSHTIPLTGQVADALSKQKDGFAAMELAVGEGNVTLDFWEPRLVVSGDIDAVTAVKDLLHAFRQSHNLLTPRDRSADVCPACFTEASSPVMLPCGHTWCRSCLQRYLKVAIEKQTAFPLKCHGIDKNCGEGIPLLTAREILAVSDFDALIEAAFTAHVRTHADELHYCPTPDCNQIYRATPEGISMQCPECLVQVCTSCHTEAHDGLTCTESRHGDGLFKEWASKHGVKQCPTCKMAIEKEEGCNHMVCGMCKTHVCWVCMQTFQNGTGIYGHMRSEHGSWGLGPIE